MKTFSILLFVSIFFLSSCRKDSFIDSPDARVTITEETISFDTVFTSTGSITKSFKIINENKQRLRISSVILGGGQGSAYSINVNGQPGNSLSPIDINGNDSIYVFVQLNIDPTSANLPFIIEDSIMISYNGRERKVELEGWGQNAHFLRDEEIVGTQQWTNDRPYVILGYLHVNPGASLTIEKGCRIYLHADAPIVVDGTLEVQGERDSIDRVYFRGDRLDEPYRDYPASWPGILFRDGSTNNRMHYADIRNAYQAIVLDGPAGNSSPMLHLENTVIDNAYDAGILSFNSHLVAINTLVTNCGKNLVFAEGGTYNLQHCTVASISNSFILHKDPVLSIANHNGGTNINPITALFQNCIFWGENGAVDDKVLVSRVGSQPFNINFENVLWKMVSSIPDITSSGIINNQDPLFQHPDINRGFYDFRLQEASPAINAGISSAISTDLDGNPRNGLPDLGAFERQ